MAKFRISYPGKSPVPLQVEGSVRFKASQWYMRGSSEVENYFCDCMKMPDVHRYTICWPEDADTPCLRPHAVPSSGFEDSAFHDHAPELNGCDQVVLLLLESPHIEEYKCDPSSGRIQPVAPAQGDTGKQIEKHLATVLKDLSRDLCDGARVVIANPVPYQASLGSIIKECENWRTVRDAVWAALWNIEAVRKDFRDRLCRYHPNIIINACTNDPSRHPVYSMNAHVTISVAAHCSETMLYASTHPSSWFNAGNRWLKRVPL